MNGCHFVFSRCVNSFRRTILKDRLCSVGGLQQYENEINPHRTNCRKRSLKFHLRNTSHIFVSSKLDLTRCNSIATLCSYLGYTSEELDSVWVVHDTWVSDSLRTSERKDETDYLVHEDLRPTKEMLPPPARKRPMLLAEEDAGDAVGADGGDGGADVGATVGDGGEHIAEFAGLRLIPLLLNDVDGKEGSMSERQTLEDPLLLASTRYNSTTMSIKQSSASSCSTSSPDGGASGDLQPGWMSRLKQTMQGKSLTRGTWVNAPLEWPAPPPAEEAAEEATAEEAAAEEAAPSSSAQSNEQQHQASNNMYRLHGSESSLDSWRSSIDRSLSTSKENIFFFLKLNYFPILIIAPFFEHTF